MEGVKLPPGLLDKTYDKRKNAALEVERNIREYISNGDKPKVDAIVALLVELANAPSHQSSQRNGGIMGLAGASISLGQYNIAPYLDQIAPPILACFHDPDHRVRYFACESMYNVAKVAKGEILVYFNELFDAMSKLAADVDQAVKNGGELLDRQIKDIVVEQASSYVSTKDFEHEAGDPSKPLRLTEKSLRAHTEGYGAFPRGPDPVTRKAFSLTRFIPLLAERIHVINPFTRTYLVTWLAVLESIPELELVSYLPHFLDGLLKFLQDPAEDIRNATMHILADFLKEIREAAEVARVKREARAAKREIRLARKRAASRSRSKSKGKDIEPGDMSITSDLETASISERRPAGSRRQSPKRGVQEGSSAVASTSSPAPATSRERPSTQLNNISEETIGETMGEKGQEGHTSEDGSSESGDDDEPSDEDAQGVGSGRWVPGQGVKVDHAAIVEILLQHLERGDEETQATCLRWLNEFLGIAKDTMITFTPTLIKLILPSLAHHFPAIGHIAKQANYNLFRVVQQLPAPPPPAEQSSQEPGLQSSASSTHRRRDSASTLPKGLTPATPNTAPVPFPSSSSPGVLSSSSSSKAANGAPASLDDMINEMNHSGPVLQPSPIPLPGTSGKLVEEPEAATDPFDYQLTVHVLLERLLDDSEETRVAAFQWLSMLHQKAPKKILGMHETFPVLLKMLSDPAEEVIKANLHLLAQISSSSEEDSYFPVFMSNLLQIFSTDRKLLETRGSLIIRQLCSSLNTERIYRTFADLLEKDEDLDFASIMVQNLHTIMITSPELSDFRKRLKNLESRDGQVLFVNLYRSWSHNAVAAFSLCLLAQAYEHAANLLQIFAELEVTVSLLIQIDKLVQLLESPVFTSLRLQLLEPDKNPYLFKCLYGLLMFLPQSSAFLTLRNRLNAVSPLGFMHVAPRNTSASAPSNMGGRSTIRRNEEIKWQELLSHFRQVQLKHERARRTQMNDSDGQSSVSPPLSLSIRPSSGASARRKEQPPPGGGPRAGTTKTGSTVSKASPLGMNRPLSPQSQSASTSRTQKRLPSVGRSRMA